MYDVYAALLYVWTSVIDNWHVLISLRLVYTWLSVHTCQPSQLSPRGGSYQWLSVVKLRVPRRTHARHSHQLNSPGSCDECEQTLVQQPTGEKSSPTQHPTSGFVVFLVAPVLFPGLKLSVVTHRKSSSSFEWVYFIFGTDFVEISWEKCSSSTKLKSL